MKARTIAAKAIRKSFKFMFACKFGEVLLRETDVMSIPLPEKKVYQHVKINELNLLDNNIKYYIEYVNLLFTV